MSINFKNVIEFSRYIDVDNIRIFQEKVSDNRVPGHRYCLYVPYKQRMSGPTATVIMYNPSKAGLRDEQGRIISDFTIYNVLQYLYHHQDGFRAVVVMNLLSSYTSNPTQLIRSNKNQLENNKTLKEWISKINSEEGDKLILAWGDLSKKVLTQIAFLRSIIGNKPVYHVEDPYRKAQSPQHGSCWADYEELKPYQL